MKKLLPYGRQLIGDDDIAAVAKVLSSDWLTTGPTVEKFESAVCNFTGAKHAVAVSSGTAALHAAMFALGIGPGDEVVVPTMTFAADANAVVYQGGLPVFADVDPDTLLIDPADAESKITRRTKAIIAVDYAGQPCDYDALRDICRRKNIALVADAAHAFGAKYRGDPVGTLADLTILSFHPVKHITTGEGGMVLTDNPSFDGRVRRFRNHGISTDHRQRTAKGTWYYEMVDLGYNYRLTDIQCALGISQLRKLPRWIDRRREIAKTYDSAFAGLPAKPLRTRPEVFHVYHLYVVRLDLDDLGKDRDALFLALRERGLGVNVHYIPVHLHPFYRRHFVTGPGMCPVAEDAYKRILSLPMFPAMSDQDVSHVISAVQEVIEPS